MNEEMLQMPSALGAKLRELRLAQGLTMQEVAERSGISQGFLSKIENDRGHPSIRNIQKLCYALNTTADDLAAMAQQGREEASPKSSSPLITRGQRTTIFRLNDVAKLESVFADSPYYKVEVLTLTGMETEYVSAKHRHDEIGVVSRGKMAVKFEDREYIMEEGDSLLIPAETEHTIRSLSCGECISIWMKLLFRPQP